MDFTDIIKDAVGPRLAYHGFKYEPVELDIVLGNYNFRRTYWCKEQCICLGRVQYDAEQIATISASEDSPIQVPAKYVLFEDPTYRLWLSTRYITAVLSNTQIVRGVSLFANTIDVQTFSVGPKWFRERNLSWSWWEFRNQAELRKVLDEILDIVLSEGLELFEREVADVRKYHEKLDQGRIAENERRSGAINKRL